MTTATRRATPLSPDDRRAAILDSVAPLVRERGLDVTTRELASAAGVAEGTLFRVFPDKSSLVVAAAHEGLRQAMAASASAAELYDIDSSLALEDRLVRVIELGQRRMGDIFEWMSVLRRFREATGEMSDDEKQRMRVRSRDLKENGDRQRAATSEAIRRVLAPDADRLRVTPEVAVMLIESAVIGTHMRTGLELSKVPAEQVADVLVHGLVRPPS